MDRSIWTLANLTEEQERLLKEAEATLGADVLLAFAPGRLNASTLTPSQLECLRGLEEKLGMAVLAVKAA